MDHGGMMLLLTFILGLVAAFIGGIAARAVHLPPIVGYLVGGMAVGPFTPGFTGDSNAMSQLAEVGVIFMMFGVGLHFSLKDLWRVKAVAIPGAIIQIILGTLAGYGLARAFGWSVEAGIMLGLSVSIASTVVLIRNLTDAGLFQTVGGKIATGWLIVEDLATIVILVVLPVVFGPGQTDGQELAAELGVALLKTVAFVAIMLVVGSRLLPWALRRIAHLNSRELFQLAVVVIALGTALLASGLFGLSVALGAFLAGVVVGSSKLSNRAAAEAIPFQDLFSIIFFASVGMMVNPLVLVSNWRELLCLLALIVVGKWLINMVLGVVLSAGGRSSLTVAAGLSQIGEFSFIIGQTGVSLGVLSSEQYSLILAGAVCSIALNSFVFKTVDPLARFMEARPRLLRLYERHTGAVAPPSGDGLTGHVVLVGYGHGGRCVADALARLGVTCLVVERDLAVAEEAEARGLPVLVGDAANSEVMEHARLSEARVLTVTCRQESTAELVVRHARSVAPGLQIVTRAETGDGVAELVEAGADDVVRPELEGGVELMRSTLLDLGYRAPQIQRYADDLRERGYEALDEAHQAERSQALDRLVASVRGIEVAWVELPAGCMAEGLSIAQTRLRTRSGASVVAVVRDGRPSVNPGPGMRLAAGDLVGLIGTLEQTEAGRALLCEPAAVPADEDGVGEEAANG